MKLKPLQEERGLGWLLCLAFGLTLSFLFGRFIEGHIQMKRKIEFCSWISKDETFVIKNYWEIKRRCGKYGNGQK